MKLLKTIIAITFLGTTWQLNAQNWDTYYEDSVVLIQFAEIEHLSERDGIKHTRIVFQYTNKTNRDITLTFLRKLAYNGVQLSDSKDREFTLKIKSNSLITYDQNKRNKAYYIFYRDLKGTIKKILTSYDLHHIKAE